MPYPKNANQILLELNMSTATAFETIDVSLKDGVSTITMQRPDVLNAFDNLNGWESL